jgi:class 3 adenylate cyclase/pimeloyl-ACP methyl ester carboxylesterase
VTDRPETGYATATDGVSLAYHVLGNGQLDVVWTPVVSFPFDLLWEEPSFAHFARRVARFSRSIWTTPRGLGGSGGDWADLFDERTLDADLSAVLDDARCDRVVLVGFGVAGSSAIHYAHAHPQRVHSLVLIDTFARYLRAPDYPIGLRESDLDRFLDRISLWGSGMSVDLLAPSRAADPLFRERIARLERLGQPPDQAAASLRRALSVDIRDLLPELRVPTLVLHRQGDRYILVDAGRYLATTIPGAKYVELPGGDNLFFVGDVDALTDELEEFLTGGRQAPEGQVTTVSILFTDIVASTEQSARLGHRRWTRLTEDHDALVRRTLQRYQGREVKSTGDGFLLTFDAASRAVRAAVEIVNAARAAGLQLRAGVHTGEVEVRSDDVVGLPVSIAKRVCDRASPGEVLVTEVVKLMTETSMHYEDRGTHDLKGVPGAWKLSSATV